MSLSVISALARLGVDPWREAARLAGLPRATAADSLAGMIDKLPAGSGLQLDAVACAARLIELLPGVSSAIAAAPAALRRGRRSGVGLSEICLILVLAVTGTTLAYQVLFSRAEPAAASVSSSTTQLQ